MKVCFYTGLFVPLTLSFLRNLTRIHQVKVHCCTKCSLDWFCEVTTLFVGNNFAIRLVTQAKFLKSTWHYLQILHNDSKHLLTKRGYQNLALYINKNKNYRIVKQHKKHLCRRLLHWCRDSVKLFLECEFLLFTCLFWGFLFFFKLPV